MKFILLQLLTGADNKTHDLGRWSWMISMAALLCGAAYNAYTNHSSGLREFAEAVGIIAAAHGVAIYAKKDTEPRRKDE